MNKATLRLNCGQPVNALSTNRDGSLVIIGGRSVLKVFALENNEFDERHSLRVGKNPNLNYSCQDVVWSPLEENLIATASTNGSVVIWKLDRPDKKKQESVYQMHKRTVNRLSFHPTDPNTVISGSQDYTVKLFDLRSKDSAVTFYSGIECAVRDVQFSPLAHNYFAAANEYGNVQCWDIRNQEKPYRQFQAHSGPVFSVAFHPTARNWIATGGRDRIIQVWSIEKEKPSCEHTVQTIASVNRVRWRPQREYHIASCSLVFDYNIHVWDIRRPYIPFALFDGHKDVATGIVWNNERNPDMFLSCGKDGALIRHSFEDAVRPADFVNQMGMHVSPSGDITWAASDRLIFADRQPSPSEFLNLPRKAVMSVSQLIGTSRGSDKFRGPNKSSLYTLFLDIGAKTTTDTLNADGYNPLSMVWFIKTAKSYKLTGLPFPNLCDYNASVANDLGRPQVAQTWQMLKTIYSFNSDAKRVESVDGGKMEPESKPIEPQLRTRSTVSFGDDVPLGHGEETEDESETPNDSAKSTVAGAGPLASTADFFFGGAELNISGTDLGALGDELSWVDWNLPREAFETKSELAQSSGGPEANEFTPSSSAGSSAQSVGVMSSASHDLVLRPPTVLEQIPTNQSMPIWDPKALVSLMLEYFAENADVQSAVSILLVLGAKGINLIEENIQEAWYLSYLELLERFELWTVSALVIKLCPLMSVKGLSQDSTTLTLDCVKCGRPLKVGSATCEQCKRTITNCSICFDLVRGQWVGCRGCGHGGHLEHMRQWFKCNRMYVCPTGCGHRCTIETLL